MAFSLQWLLLLQSTGCEAWSSVVMVHGLSYPQGTWNLPEPVIEPVSYPGRQIINHQTPREIPDFLFSIYVGFKST